MTAELTAEIDDDVDPRWLRSRTRLLDAAADLLRAGGIDAVTIDAVTKESKVARTTLYRHFGCSSDLLAATLELVFPPITQPPSTGSLRDRLVELVCRQTTLYEEAPLYLTTLAWLAMRSNTDDAGTVFVVDDTHTGHPCDQQRPRELAHGELEVELVELIVSLGTLQDGLQRLDVVVDDACLQHAVGCVVGIVGIGPQG